MSFWEKKSRTDVTFKRHLSQGPCNGGGIRDSIPVPGARRGQVDLRISMSKNQSRGPYQGFPRARSSLARLLISPIWISICFELISFWEKKSQILDWWLSKVCVLKWLLEELACKTRIRIEFTLFTLFSSLSFYFIS